MNHSRIRVALLLAAVASFALVGTAAAASPEPETAAIVNGTQVSQSEFDARWPFMVGIVKAGARTQYDGQFCGGSLIDDQHVLTAAHCVTLEPSVVSAPTGVRVVAKTRTLDDLGRGSGESGLRVVSDVFVHPAFAENDGQGYRFDVAVLRLVTPVTAASPIALVQPGEGALWGNGGGGVNGFVAGWGDTDPLDRGTGQSRFPTVLRQATVPLRSDATCGSTVGGGYGTAFERATNLCAGTLRSGATLGVDACQGDSGGPLTVAAPDGSLRLAGVTSWGEGCADRHFGAYARIDALRGWIASVPGATDGAAGTGGPGGTMPVPALRVASRTYGAVRLAWDAPATGSTPERYAVWRRMVEDGNRVEQLVGITTTTSFRAPVEPSRRAGSRATWVVRPLDAGGSNGVGSLLRAGPRPDLVRPGLVRVSVARRGATSAVVRWSRAIDRQTGIAGYTVQRRLADRRGAWSNAAAQLNGRSARLYGLPRGERIQVRVRAFDRAGNVAGWSRAITLRTAG